MKNIKPIPTTYKGVKYRSRLEARWAIFFDGLKIKFEYELEGCQLPSGIKYLPDFYLPELRVFVELKPSDELTRFDIAKISEFAIHEEDINLLLIIGSPGKETIYLMNRYSCTTIEEYPEDEFSSDKELFTAFFENVDKVKFSPIPLIRELPQWKIVYSELPPYYDCDMLEAVQKSQFQFDFKKKED